MLVSVAVLALAAVLIVTGVALLNVPAALIFSGLLLGAAALLIDTDTTEGKG